MDQEKLFFGRKMDPFDYEQELAGKGKDCIAINASEGGRKTTLAKNDDGRE